MIFISKLFPGSSCYAHDGLGLVRIAILVDKPGLNAVI